MEKEKNWGFTFFLIFLSFPIFILYFFLLLDTLTVTTSGSIWPESFTFHNWRFLTETIVGHPSIWQSTWNTFLFAASTSILVLIFSATAGYSLSRLQFPFRKTLLGGVLLLHAFPSVTLLISIFIMLRVMGLYDTLIGVILVKASLEMPFGIWIMKGFYDTVPWEIEMAGVQDGASRFKVWYKLVLPQIKPGLAALAIFSFMAGWGEYLLPFILAPSAEVRTLSVFLVGLIDDNNLGSDYGLFKAVGLFYIIPVLIFYLFTQDKLMNIYGGGSKG